MPTKPKSSKSPPPKSNPPKAPTNTSKQSNPKSNNQKPNSNQSNNQKSAASQSNKPNQSTPQQQDSNYQTDLFSSFQNTSQSLQQGQAYLGVADQIDDSITDISSLASSTLGGFTQKISGDFLNAQLQRFQAIDSRFSSTKEPDIYRLNYIPVNHFYVEMDGKVKAAFKEFSGISVNLKKESYLEGGVNDQQRVMLGHAEFSDVTLKRGMTDDGIFLNWVMQTLLGKPKNRRNINIILFNQAGETMQCYTLIGAIPISWKTPGFQADGNSVAIEELTLAYEGLNVSTKTPGGGPTLNIKRDSKGFFPDK